MTKQMLSRLAGLIAITTMPTIAQSQSGEVRAASDTTPTGASVTLVLLGQLPTSNAQAVLMRRAGSTNSVILLAASDTSVTSMAAALAILDRLRSTEGDEAVRDTYVVIRNAVLPGGLSPAYRERLAQRFASLRAASPRGVNGVEGTHRAIQVTLPRRGR